MNALEIQLVALADRDDLARLMLQSNRHYWGENADAEDMTRAAAGRIADGSAGCRAVIGRIGEEPVAFATFAILLPSIDEHGTVFMKDLYTTDARRGFGIGKRMMAYMASLAVALGCKRFDWTAETDNPGAIRFYDDIAAERVEEKVYFRFSSQNLARLAASNPNVC